MTMQPIKNPIGQGHLPDWNDLNTMRGIFRDLGLYDADETGPMLDKSLTDAIKAFQDLQDLKVDGLINPGGETERALFKEKGEPYPRFIQVEKDGKNSIGFGGNVSGVLASSPPKPARKPDFKSDRNLFDLSSNAQNKKSLFDIQPPTDQIVDKKKMHDILDFDVNKGGGDFRSFIQFGMKPDEIARKAEKEAKKIFPNARGFEDESDAFRHALGAYLISQEIGPDNAKKVLDRHERFPMSGLSPKDTEMGMLQDLYNNNVGIEAAKNPENKDRDPVEVIQELYNSGKLQTKPFRLKNK